jgi:hypothetical protein
MGYLKSISRDTSSMICEVSTRRRLPSAGTPLHEEPHSVAFRHCKVSVRMLRGLVLTASVCFSTMKLIPKACRAISTCFQGKNPLPGGTQHLLSINSASVKPPISGDRHRIGPPKPNEILKMVGFYQTTCPSTGILSSYNIADCGDGLVGYSPNSFGPEIFRDTCLQSEMLLDYFRKYKNTLHMKIRCVPKKNPLCKIDTESRFLKVGISRSARRDSGGKICFGALAQTRQLLASSMQPQMKVRQKSK